MKKRMIFIFIGIAVIGIAYMVMILLPAERHTDAVPNGGGKRAVVHINNHSIPVDVADTAASREQGLSGHEKLPENEGMLFIFAVPGPYGFWMKDMKFPLDMIWIRGNTVIGVTENVDPQIGESIMKLKIYYPPGVADKILEMDAGSVERLGITKGNTIQIEYPK